MSGMVTVSRETQQRLDAFMQLLRHWSQTINLVSKADLAGKLQERHIADSLALVPHLPPQGNNLVDIGSGGGLPAIPIAIATGRCVHLVEADHRKAAFLETALATLGIKGAVWADRIETTLAPPAGCVTARALAPLPVLLGYAHRLLLPGGTALFLKGEQVEAEIVAARMSWRMDVVILPGSMPRTRILKVSSLEPIYDALR